MRTTATLTEAFNRRIHAFLTPTEEFYSPTQPRDKNGRWTSHAGRPASHIPADLAPITTPGKVWSGISAHPDHRNKPTPKVSFPLEGDDYDIDSPVQVLGRKLFNADLGDGYHSSVVEVEDHGYSPGATFRGYIYKGLREVGSFERTLIQQPDGSLVMHHDEIYINPSQRGRGLADRFNAHAVAEYQNIGVDHVRLTTDDVGGFAWARQGFRHDNGTATADKDRRAFLNNELDRVEGQVKHVPAVRDHASEITPQIRALRKAIDAGEDVQPIHVAALGERYRWVSRDAEGNEYETWAGKQVLLRTRWNGAYYFDANKPVTAAATDLEHAHLRPAFRFTDKVSDLAEAFACHHPSCRPPTSGGTGGSSRKKGSLPRGANPEVRHEQRLGSMDKVITSGSQQFQNLVPENLDDAIRIRVTAETLVKVFEDGKVKTQYESGHSGGMFNPTLRRDHEMAMYGTTYTSNKSPRPVYGYVTPDPAAAKDAGFEYRSVFLYGDFAIVLKPEVQHRTTVTMGDSLRLSDAPAPIKVTEVRGTDAKTLDGSLRLQSAMTQPPYSASYIEAQIIGGVKVSDIQKIVIEHSPPDTGYDRRKVDAIEKIKPYLDELGIELVEYPYSDITVDYGAEGL